MKRILIAFTIILSCYTVGANAACTYNPVYKTTVCTKNTKKQPATRQKNTVTRKVN